MLVPIPASAATLEQAVWIDLLDPSPEERASVEAATKLRLPTKADLEEIESSSRVYVEEGALYLSTPVLAGPDALPIGAPTLGFVLTPKVLVTLRFSPVRWLDALRQGYKQGNHQGPYDAFLRILELMIDQAADALEHASAELEGVSHAAFSEEGLSGRKHKKTSQDLRAALRKLGCMGDGISHIRDTLLGVGRIAAFVEESAHQSVDKDVSVRLHAIRGDISSLNDYQGYLAAKVQFLLDATLGFISMQQNDIVKTLTIVSVVGVPPVLIAGIYGMNFRFMPELGWALGYPFALALIVVSALLPIAWFKWRGWI